MSAMVLNTRFTPTLILGAITQGMVFVSPFTSSNSSFEKPVVPITKGIFLIEAILRFSIVDFGIVNSITTSESSIILERLSVMDMPTFPHIADSPASFPID